MKGYVNKRDRLYVHKDLNLMVLAENKREATYVMSRVAGRVLTMKGVHFVKVANKLEKEIYSSWADPLKDAGLMRQLKRNLTNHS